MTSARTKLNAIALFVLVSFALLGVYFFLVGRSSAPFMPHRTCYLNDTRLICLHVVSDLLIGAAYIAISTTLAYLVARARREMPFHWMMMAFAVFIVACGATHWMEVWTVWTPRYWLAGSIKLVTAIASVATAAVLPALIPKILALLEAARLSTRHKLELETANTKLETLYERVTQLDQLKTNFFANVSHEFRTPLTLILGPVDRALASPDTPDAARHTLTGVRRNAMILLKHVTDLLDVSKLDAGKMKPTYSEVDLARLMRLVAGYFETLAQERLVQFSVDTPPSLVAQVDADKMERVLINLLSNAVKFVPEAGNVRCNLARHEDRVTITIEDNGPGIPVELRKSIFERFNQGGSGTAQRFDGTGLGLTIVKDFVELHEGVIRCGESWQGGAAFIIEMPLRAPAGTPILATHTDSSGTIRVGEPPLAAQHMTAIPGQAEWSRQGQLGLGLAAGAPPSNIPGSQPLVLVVEDTPEMNDFIVQILADEFRVARAYDGAEGFEKALELQPDVIVTDMMMPKMGGQALLNKVRNTHSLSATPVVLLTARADDALKMNLLQTGAQDYVTKPFAVEELRTRVRNLIAGKLVRDMLQHELATQNSDLSQLAREITRRTRDLQQAKEIAEAANRAKDHFLAVLSHELRTPLTPVLSALAHLQAGDHLPAQTHETLDMIRRNVELEARLIDDLLDLTRVSKGKLQLNRETVDVHALLSHALEICASEIAHKRLALGRELRAANSYASVDSARLLQVLWNLIQNAVKFTPEGGRLQVRTANTDDGELCIEISDSGVGIEPEILPKIFNAFEQGDASTTRKFGGLGLGLALARTLVEAHGGTIRATSEGRDRGTQIWLHLAAVEKPPKAEDQTAAPPMAESSGEPLRILLVEDHEDTRTALTRLLARWGYVVEAADSVADALGKAQESSFDLLISDLGLPDGTGADLMRTLHSQFGIPGIAVSGFGMEHDVENSRTAGFAEHLTKPVSGANLKAAIDRVARQGARV